jgi:hypothetical protein
MAKETSKVLARGLPFSGKPEEWDIWSDKFLSIAQAKGWVKALFPGDVLPASADVTLDETIDADKLTQKVWRNLLSVDDDKTAPAEKGQLLHLDMMSVKVPKGLTLNKKQLWMIVDAHTCVEFVEAYAKKSDMPDNTCRLF